MIGNVNQLVDAVQHAARAEAQEQRSQAEKEAESILEEAREEAEREREGIITEARSQAEQQRKKRITEAANEARQRYFSAREELLNQVWQQAENQLKELRDNPDNYAAVLKHLALDAVKDAKKKARFRLAADEKGHELLTEKRLSQWSEEAGIEFTRSDEALDTWGGLMLFDADSRRRIDRTFETRLQLAWEELRADVYERLLHG